MVASLCRVPVLCTRRTHWSSKHALSVLRSDNTTRVRDGYNRLTTRGHARASATQNDLPICRENVPADAPPCPPIPTQNLHGKEGVDGSSPSEGS
jgi:hypothetical protein